MRSLRVGMLLAALAAGACGREKGTDARDSEPAPGGSVRLSDGDVVMLVTQVSTGEIAAATAARGKLQNPEVRAYAERMLAEHGAMNDGMRSLPVKGDTVSRPPLQFALRQAVSADEGALISTMPAGPAFDRTFIAMQVNGHAAALDSLRKWRRMVQTPAVRDRIGGAIPTVEAHLAQARSIQSRLGPGTATGAVLPPPPDTAWYKGPSEPAPADTGKNAVVPTRDATGGAMPPAGPATARKPSHPAPPVKRAPPPADTARPRP